MKCEGCNATTNAPTRFGWRRVLGRLLCAMCAQGFPNWM